MSQTTLTPGQKAYIEFIQSPFWINLVTARKAYACSRCELCDTKHRPLQGHHLIYRRNWMDTCISDIRALCEPCHLFAHRNFPRFSADQNTAQTVWDNLVKVATNHVKGVQLADKKLEKQKAKIREDGQFWVLLSQDEGMILRKLLKDEAGRSPDSLESLRGLAKLIRVRMKMAEKRKEIRKKKWDSITSVQQP